MKKLSLIALALLFSSACSGPKSVQTVPVVEQPGQQGAQQSSDIIAPSDVPPSDDFDFGNPPGNSVSDGGSLPADDADENGPEEAPQDAPAQGEDTSGNPSDAVSIPEGGSVVSVDQTELTKSGPLSKASTAGVVLVDKSTSTQGETPASSRIHVFAIRKFQRGLGDWGSTLHHVSADESYTGALWGSAHTVQFIPAPLENGKPLDLHESPAVTQTKTGFHIVSRSDDKLLYWECDKEMSCTSKVINGGDNLKVQGCVAITSDPYGRVYIFAKHNPSSRLEIFQGTGVEDMHSAGNLFSGGDVQSCPAAAYHPDMKRVYVFSSRDGDLIAGFSGKIPDAASTVKFDQGGMTAARKFNAGMASCGENGRLTTVYNPVLKKMSILHHENGGSDTVIQSFGFEDEQTGFKSSVPVLQKQLSKQTDEGDDIDDFPVGVYDDLGVLHAFGDKAYSNGFYEVEKAADGVSFESSVVEDNVIQVERAPAAVFDPNQKVVHLFARRRNECDSGIVPCKPFENALAHLVKERRPDGSWSPWHAEVLVDDGKHKFDGCPAALIEN